MLLKNTALYSLGEFAGRIGKLLSLYLIAALTAKADFGAYAFILSLSLIVITLFDFGDNTLVLLRVTRGKFPLLMPYFYFAKLITTVCSTVAVLLVYRFIPIPGGLTSALIPAFLLYCVGFDLQTFLGNAQRARHDFAGETWSKLIANFGFLFVLVAAMAAHMRLSTNVALWIQALTLLTGAAFSFRRTRPYLNHLFPPWRHARRGVWAILRIGAPMTLATSVGVLQASIDSLVLGGTSHLDANASFSITQRLAQITYLPLGILVSVALPYLSLSLRGGKRSLDADMLDQSLLALTVAGAASGQIFVLIGEWLIPYTLGHRYADVAQYSQVLALYIIPIYIFPVLTGLLWVMRVVVMTQSLYGISTFTSFVLDIVAIRYFGPFSVAWVAVSVNWAMFLCFVMLYRFRIKTWPLRWPTLVAALVGTGLIALPYIMWPAPNFTESALRACVATALLTLLGTMAWRKRAFIRGLAMHRVGL